MHTLHSFPLFGKPENKEVKILLEIFTISEAQFINNPDIKKLQKQLAINLFTYIFRCHFLWYFQMITDYNIAL